ncbi:uncharacterized protein LOC118404695 isoform X2 [Branchiostoma floridae]|uniref:Uncharacterized protein LOC118404695 isoform X2 n=1 Tax=Branchiostoma floridae TaxID=7739 RepID=A0A9J7KI60_BRAFL|nr:uncharacterized protein LOC118404695 isoform X2 [Branchiostoma floridae]XP_035659843.1 uncharacterized protein LOC118404695 isoform X2 [Branchiostoma floridae]
MEQNMEQLAQLQALNGRWKQDHSQNENYDQFLRENGVPWFCCKIASWLKISPVEEYIITGDQITYRQYENNDSRTISFEMTLTVGQPPVNIAAGFSHFQAQISWDQYGRLVTRTRKKSGEFIQTGRMDSKGDLERPFFHREKLADGF